MWWGVSYEGCSANPVSGYTRQQLRLDTDYRYKMLPGFYLGATLNLNYTRALNMGAPEYLEGQKDSYYFTGLGLSLQYDTRDLIMNPSRGIYFMAREVIYPKVFSTHDRTVWGTTIIFDAFVPAWKGGVVAFDLYGQLNSRDTPGLSGRSRDRFPFLCGVQPERDSPELRDWSPLRVQAQDEHKD